jgi:starvation-inducible outer membrane lipoprotein
MRARILLLTAVVALTAATAALAQAPAAPVVQDPPALEGRRNQRVEHIHVEDAAVSIDEVRYGGQTQSITVQPKANVPEYEIQPTDLGRSRPADHRDGMSSATGKRVWNVIRF